MSTIHFCSQLLGCQMHEKVLFRMSVSFYFKIPFYNLNSGTGSYAPQSLVSFGILNTQPNEKLIGDSLLNSKYSHCSFKARGKNLKSPSHCRAERREIICLPLGI